MSIIKSFSVGNGDMIYINHVSPNFTLIDCNLTDDNKARIAKEIKDQINGKEITRFISTHPDEDHFHGLLYLDEQINILNFYCVKNSATKKIETPDFKKYCSFRDSDKAFYLERGCKRKWMNEDGNDKNGKFIMNAGLEILWPITTNQDFKDALKIANDGGEQNNISPIIKYEMNSGAKVIWMGDLETEFMEKIRTSVSLADIDILFAPHHGRDTGKVPESWLKEMTPKLIVIGEAPSKDLNYYSGYNTITQLSAGDITFDCVSGKVHVYVSNSTYKVNYLKNENMNSFNYYLGTLVL
jgi:beta-lactamase superfamily II metal-dependent hydrolase